MTITQIECFVEAARVKSLSKAAAKLFISQPTISRQIRALEKDLGFPLFERKNIGVRLTPMGEILFLEWKKMLHIHRSAVDKAKDLYYGEQKNIRIGIHDFVEPRERIANALIRYNQKYPELEVEYEILQMSELLSGVEEGKLHCVIAYASEIEDRYGLKTLYLDEISMRAGIVCSRNHPMSKRTQLDLADVQGETVGIFSENASLDHGKRIKKLLDDHDLSSRVELKEFNSWQNLQIALTTGKCITVMYERIMAGMEKDLMFYPLKLEADISKIMIAWKDDRYEMKAKNIIQVYK